MSLLRAFATTETARVLRGGEGASAVHLRAPQPHDFIDWAALREESRAFLQPWEPQWADDELTPPGLSPPPASLCPRDPRRPSLSVFPVSRGGRGAGRRGDTVQYPPRRGTGLLARLLDGGRPCRQGLHERGGARAAVLRLRGTCLAPGRGGVPASQCRIAASP